jgi:hypothetical protein
VINLDNLIVGDKLYFNSGQSTPSTVRKLTATGRWRLPVAMASMPQQILAITRLIHEALAAVTTAKCLM